MTCSGVKPFGISSSALKFTSSLKKNAAMGTASSRVAILSFNIGAIWINLSLSAGIFSRSKNG
jgi:hypothetical protein